MVGGELASSSASSGAGWMNSGAAVELMSLSPPAAKKAINCVGGQNDGKLNGRTGRRAQNGWNDSISAPNSVVRKTMRTMEGRTEEGRSKMDDRALLGGVLGQEPVGARNCGGHVARNVVGLSRMARGCGTPEQKWRNLNLGVKS